MQTEAIISFVKRNKIKLITISILLALGLLFFGLPPLLVKSSSKSQLKELCETKYKLEDVTITLKNAGRADKPLHYYAYIDCSNLHDFTYEEMTRLAGISSFSEDVTIKNFTCDGDTYVIYYLSVYKNGEKVYEDNSHTSSSPSHSCIECGASASRSYSSPFSGQTEWYCSSCYRKLQNLLDQFGLD